MIPELGHLALIIALVLACLQLVVPAAGIATNNSRWIATGRSLALGQLVFLAVSFLALCQSFIDQDFSVVYVAQNSNLELPLVYRISAVWGAHEGSLLLWALVMGIWTAAVAVGTRQLPEPFVARVLAALGGISVGFICFMLFTSNPFLRHIPALADGSDLNPLLQDFGLIVHPPMLYVGYVGMAVPFAFAVAALSSKTYEARWADWSRGWTKVAWAFLTVGIALGSWWAYYELGWGGWWFWDPVENASFMPWLAGVALIHSQAATARRGVFHSWTLLLALSCFALSLLGTFLVRSGVLTSVHAFASDPERGLFILLFLGVVVGTGLFLFAWRAPRKREEPAFGPVSRETALLANNALFTVATAMVLLGTLYPLFAEAIGQGKLSVGPPYFSIMFSILMAPVVLLLPFGALSRWRNDQPARIVSVVRWSLTAAVAAAILLWILNRDWPFFAALWVLGGLWVLAGAWALLDDRRRRGGLNVQVWGMTVAHAGVGVFLIGTGLVENTLLTRDVRMAPGDTVEMGGYQFTLERIEGVNGPNFEADRAYIRVLEPGGQESLMTPEKRLYRSDRSNIMTEAAIRPGPFQDIYVAMGEPLDNGAAWAMRLYVKPFVRWIWLGSLMMAMGGILAALPWRRTARERNAERVNDPSLARA